MPIIKVKKQTWTDVKDAEEAMRLDFAKSVFEDYYTYGKSLRVIADERKTSHETVRRLIKFAESAREPQTTRRGNKPEVTA